MQRLVNRRAKFLQIAGRLRSGVSPEQARAELATIADRLEEAYPGESGRSDDSTPPHAAGLESRWGIAAGKKFILGHR